MNIRVPRAWATVLLPVLLVGCATTHVGVDYPSGWPPPTSTPAFAHCPQLNGTYSNVADRIAAYDGATAPKLSEIFSSMSLGMFSPTKKEYEWPDIAAADTVSFDLTPTTLDITFAAEGSESTTLHFRTHPHDWNEKRYDDMFYCMLDESTPTLWFMAQPSQNLVRPAPNTTGDVAKGLALISVGVVRVGGDTPAEPLLQHSDDGALVIKLTHISLVGHVFLIGTHFRDDRIWWRYPPVHRAPTERPAE